MKGHLRKMKSYYDKDRMNEGKLENYVVGCKRMIRGKRDEEDEGDGR